MRSNFIFLCLIAGIFACSTDESQELSFDAFVGIDSVRIHPKTIEFLPRDGRKDTTIQFSVSAYLNPNSVGISGVFVSIKSVDRDSVFLFPEPMQTVGGQVFTATIPTRLVTTNNDKIEFEVNPIKTGYASVQSWKIYVDVKANRGSPPSIDEVTFPETVVKPASGSVPVKFTARVSDPDGLSNIARVTFSIYDIDGNLVSSGLELLDDGQATSGDVAARDGVFTRTLQIDNTNTARTLKLRFSATDRSGNLSNIVERPFTISNP